MENFTTHSLFTTEDCAMTPAVAPDIDEACKVATRVLRSQLFSSVFNSAVGKNDPHHNLSLTNELNKIFSVESDALLGAYDRGSYSFIEKNGDAPVETARTIMINPVLLANMSKVLNSLVCSPAHEQAKQNFTALLTVKLIREVSQLLLFYCFLNNSC